MFRIRPFTDKIGPAYAEPPVYAAGPLVIEGRVAANPIHDVANINQAEYIPGMLSDKLKYYASLNLLMAQEAPILTKNEVYCWTPTFYKTRLLAPLQSYSAASTSFQASSPPPLASANSHRCLFILPLLSLATSYRLPNSRKMQFKFASVALLAIVLTLSVVRAQDDTFDDSSPMVGDYEPADDDYNNYLERRAWFDGHDDGYRSYGYLVRRDFDGGYSGGHGGHGSAGGAGGYSGAGGLGGFGYIPSIRATDSRTNAKVLKNQKLAFAKLKNKKIKADSKLAVKA
ncbi:hypothetical protein BJ085DRAFT_38911 [Dimargaris cristalligena]|uniref:Uncharacterized protein n=1 Tax=Dimargaris cristalligena TaxID=215637 RepID=A0A4P9ZTH7_9FUNG|nr:hypothetical protein BJ085DRAFT_38911 [Dimargaris cristalligena]|eukprot:RKP36528.1 hypothetical protein BJ085DRAFT_38911 [Dimargaris cristalligena]